MKETRTLQELQAENAMLEEQLQRLKERVAYLERLLFGSKRDKKENYDGPGLFDDVFEEASEQRDAEIAQMAKEIHVEAEKRRSRAKAEPSRPARYHDHGLEERRTVMLPEGCDVDDYDVIGKDTTRVLHREPAKVWVEIIERPILRHKEDVDKPSPRIIQAPAPPEHHRRQSCRSRHAFADYHRQICLSSARIPSSQAI